MRDLHSEAPPNGAPPDRVELDDDEPLRLNLSAGDARQAARVERRDRALASTAVLMIDTAKYLEPLLAVLTVTLLRWAALAGAVALAVLAIREPRWEKVAALAVYMILVPLLVRKGVP